VTLQQICGVMLKRPVPWGSMPHALFLFRSMVSGIADNTRTLDITDVLANEVKAIEPEKLAKKLLCSSVNWSRRLNGMFYFNARAIIPSSVPLEHLFVARESLNGTLVFAVYHWDEIVKARSSSLKSEEISEPSAGAKPSATEVKSLYRERAKKAQIVVYLSMTSGKRQIPSQSRRDGYCQRSVQNQRYSWARAILVGRGF
jgi:hypothetical protein